LSLTGSNCPFNIFKIDKGTFNTLIHDLITIYDGLKSPKISIRKP